MFQNSKILSPRLQLNLGLDQNIKPEMIYSLPLPWGRYCIYLLKVVVRSGRLTQSHWMFFSLSTWITNVMKPCNYTARLKNTLLRLMILGTGYPVSETDFGSQHKCWRLLTSQAWRRFAEQINGQVSIW